MSDIAKCGLCGEPMPPGEEMFIYHGYSCDCPPKIRSITEGGPKATRSTPATNPIAYAIQNDQGYWIGIWNDKETAELVLGQGQQTHNEVIVPLALVANSSIPADLRRQIREERRELREEYQHALDTQIANAKEVENERNTWRELANNAEADAKYLREKRRELVEAYREQLVLARNRLQHFGKTTHEIDAFLLAREGGKL